MPSDLNPCGIAMPVDFNGVIVDEVNEAERFMGVRPEDNLATSFHCPNCQSQNIQGKDLDMCVMDDTCFESLCIRTLLTRFGQGPRVQ